MVPVPYVSVCIVMSFLEGSADWGHKAFYRYGTKIRARSRYAQSNT